MTSLFVMVLQMPAVANTSQETENIAQKTYGLNKVTTLKKKLF